MVQFIIVDSCSNLFLKKLMLSCPVMRRFMLFILISFRKDCGSFISVSFEFLRGELDDTSSHFWLGIPWPFLLGCNLSGKRSNLLFMFLCNIKAKFSALYFSCNSSLTFFLSQIVDLHDVSRMI